MQDFDSFDWSSGTEEEHLAMARLGTSFQLRDLARNYDWWQHPERLFGWVMAQKGIDLGTALTVFFNGEPERFNYMPKRDVPEGYRGITRLLDNACLRLNSGFYLFDPDSAAADAGRIKKWIAFQAVDRAEGRRGRWLLDEGILEPLLYGTLHLERSPEDKKTSSLLMDILSPAIDLATKRVIEDEPKPDARSQLPRG